jgi:creatinine amidohydrolase
MELLNTTWPSVDLLSRDTPVVLPIAALEQHGRHLPLFTDSLLLAEIVRRVASVHGGRVLFAPVMWLGNSEHHLDFPGTLSATPRTYLDLLRDMVECFLGHGFRRIVLLNSHGGNSIPAQQVLFELRQKHRQRQDLLLLLANYWSLGSQPHATIPGLTQPQIQHACQWETSMMLHLRADLVGNFSCAIPVDYGNPFLPAQRAAITKDFSADGHVGNPATATAEIGAALFQAFAADVVALLERMLAWDGNSWNG